jgi:DNA-directed RNA polymerase specialized sigma24 family protein
MATCSQIGSKTPFDVAKLPIVLRRSLPLAFDIALKLSRNESVAWEITNEVFLLLVDDPKWDPEVSTVEEHVRALVNAAYTKVRFNSYEERQVRATYERYVREPTKSPEDIALFVEEQDDLDRDDDERTGLAERIRARIAGHDVASRVALVWQEHGRLPPRDVARMLGVPVRAVYNAIRVIEHHARKAQDGGR